jgi:hypothetical protein
MQGTILMLMALSGLGCHHKSCDVACVPSCYGTGACDGGRYATEYSTMVEPSCYSGCYTDCNSGSCGCYRTGFALDGLGPACGGYVGCYAGGAVGCGSSRFPHHDCLLGGLSH